MQFHKSQILTGTVKEVRNLIKREYDINRPCRELNKYTPLYYALNRYCESTDSEEKNTSLSIAQLLLNKGAKINNNENGLSSDQSPLSYALCNCDLKVVQLLLNLESIQTNIEFIQTNIESSQTNISERNYSLESDVFGQTQTVVKLLLTVVEDLLYFAFRHRHKKLVKIILDDKSASDINRSILRIFHYCLYNRDRETIKYLFELYPESIDTPDSDRKTPLHLSVLLDFNQVALYFLDCGASVDSTDFVGMTPLSYAVQQGERIELIEHILRKGVDVNQNRCSNGETALHLASDLLIMKLLVKFGADVNAIDIEGKSPLHNACWHANEEIVSYLLQAGANVNAVCNEGLTTLHYACKNYSISSIHIIKLLLNHGIDVNVRDFFNKTPLHYISTNSGGALNYLVKQGTDINAADFLGNTVLHRIFTDFSYGEDINHFLELEADVNVINNEGQTPLECALSIVDLQEDQQDNVETLIIHLVKMKVENADISEKNLNALKSIPLFAEYDLEIENMKKKICSNSYVTFFDFLTKGSRKLARFCRHKDTEEVLESLDYESDFLELKIHLFRRIKDALYVCCLFDAVTIISIKYLKWKMPCMIVDEIFGYLENEDIEYFIKHSPISLRKYGCNYFTKYAYMI